MYLTNPVARSSLSEEHKVPQEDFAALQEIEVVQEDSQKNLALLFMLTLDTDAQTVGMKTPLAPSTQVMTVNSMSGKQRWHAAFRKIRSSSQSAENAKQMAIQAKWTTLIQALNQQKQQAQQTKQRVDQHKQAMLNHLFSINTPESLCHAYKLTHLLTPTILAESLTTKKQWHHRRKDHYIEHIAMGVYLENHRLFEKTAKQLLDFFCYSPCPEHRNPASPYQKACKPEAPLYGHIVPYLGHDAKGRLVGKVRLIDKTVGHFYPCMNSILDACRNAIKYFPYQMDRILTAAYKMIDYRFLEEARLRGIPEEVAKTQAEHSSTYKKIAQNLPEFQSIQQATFNYFQLAYQIHRDFAQRQGITSSRPGQCIAVTEARLKQIQEAVVESLLKFNRKKLKDFLGQNPELTLQLFRETFPEILQITMHHIYKTLTDNVTRHAQYAPLLDYPNLLYARNVTFPTLEAVQELQHKLICLSENASHREDYAQWVLYAIFKALSGHEIAAYYPEFGSDSRDRLLC